MADLSLSLKHYLSSLAHRRWQPGVLDCGVFMADWVREICGRDPIADVRGSYATVEEFERILDREGGFLRTLGRRLRRVGFVRSLSPSAGDLAAVMAPYAIEHGEIKRRPTGAICVTDDLRAVITSDLGIVIAGNQALPLIKAYRIG